MVLRHRAAAARRAQRAAHPRGARRLGRRPGQPGRRRGRRRCADLRGVRRVLWTFMRGGGQVELGALERRPLVDDFGRQAVSFARHRAGVDAGVARLFLVLRDELGPLWANFIGFTATTVGNNWANRRWTFRRRGTADRRWHIAGIFAVYSPRSRCRRSPSRSSTANLGAELLTLIVTWGVAGVIRFSVLARAGCSAAPCRTRVERRVTRPPARRSHSGPCRAGGRRGRARGDRPGRPRAEGELRRPSVERDGQLAGRRVGDDHHLGTWAGDLHRRAGSCPGGVGEVDACRPVAAVRRTAASSRARWRAGRPPAAAHVHGAAQDPSARVTARAAPSGPARRCTRRHSPAPRRRRRRGRRASRRRATRRRAGRRGTRRGRPGSASR